MKNLHKSKRWEYYVYPLNKEFLSGNSLKGALNAYFRDIVSKLRDNDFIMTQFSIGYGDQVKSISPLDTNNNKDFDELLDSFTDFLNLKIEDNSISGVDLEDIETIIFKYRHLSNEDGKTTTSIHWPVFNETVDQVDVKKVKTYKHFGFKLPSTMDLRSWGEILHQTDNYFHIKKYKSDWYYYIDLKDECMEVELKDKKGVCILKFVDHPDLSNESPLWNFERKIFIKSPEGYILKYIHYFEDGVKTLQKVMKKVKFLKTKVNDTSFTLDIITMDLETRAIDGYMWPYCISIYDGNNHKTWYQADHVDMIEHAVSYLLNEKYDKFKIYTHNFSHFDSVFLLKSLHKLCKRISPTIRDGRFIETKIILIKK